jgi:hypothetical protein
MQIGTNLNGVSYYGEQHPFSNHFKASSEWIPFNTNSKLWKTDSINIQSFFDEYNYIKRMPVESDLVPYNAFKTIIKTGQSGNYEVTFDGEGVIKYTLGAKLISIINPNKHLISINNNSNPVIEIRSVNPNNYIKNISVTKEGNNPNQLFNPDWLSKINQYSTLRFMNWQSINNSIESTWYSRSKVQSARYLTVPAEIMVELCNTTHQNPWFCMPHLADENYITEFATLVRNNLNPELTVYVEYSNEVWNPQFNQTKWVTAEAKKIALKNIDLYSKYSSRNALIFKSVFGTNKAHLVKGVLAGQLGNSSLLPNALKFLWDSNRQINPNPKDYGIDIGSVATYFGIDKSINDETLLSWANDPESLSLLFNALQTSIYQKIKPRISAVKKVCFDKGLQFAVYEGGQHLATSVAGRQINYPEVQDMYYAANRHPRMGELYSLLLNDALSPLTQNDLFCHFSDVCPQTKFGSWGAVEGTYSIYPSPKYDALMNFIINQAQLSQ